MKSVYFFLLLCFLSCANRDPLPPPGIECEFTAPIVCETCVDIYPLPPSIEGRWRRLIPVHPPVEYSLHNGILLQTTFAAGVPVAEIERVYVLQGDTLLRIGGAVGDPERIWRYRLIGPEAAEVYETGAPLGAYIILERL